jgi:hypothetical protein
MTQINGLLKNSRVSAFEGAYLQVRQRKPFIFSIPSGLHSLLKNAAWRDFEGA